MSNLFDIDQIAEILQMLEKHNVTEFKLERGEEKLLLRRGADEEEECLGCAHTAMPIQFAPQYLQHPGQQFAPIGHQVATQQIPVQQAPAQNGADSTAQPAEAVPAKPAPNLKDIRSPMVGTFYRRPAVDAEPYVQVGDVVKKGDVLCIVEAMKLMNEIESDVAGKIAEIRLDDGQMVEYNEVLFRIEPL